MERRIPILLVDDEGDQAQLIQEYLQEANDAHDVHRVQSGEEAIAYLSGQGKFADRNAYPFPFVVLLDLKMPGVGGFGVLRWLSGERELRDKLNVIVLSSSESVKEIEVVHELGAKFFWAKSECDRIGEKIMCFEEAVADSQLHGAD